MEGCVLSSAQGQGCAITQPAPFDGLRVKCVPYCLAPASLTLECNTSSFQLGEKYCLLVPLPTFMDLLSLTLEASLWEAGVAQVL